MGWTCSCVSAKIVGTDILLHTLIATFLSSFQSKWRAENTFFPTNFETLWKKSIQSSSVRVIYPSTSKGPRYCFPVRLMAIILASQDVDSAGSQCLFPPVDLLEQWTAGTQVGRKCEGGKISSFGLVQNKNNYVRNWMGRGQEKKSSYHAVYRGHFTFHFSPTMKITASLIINSLLTSWLDMSLPWLNAPRILQRAHKGLQSSMYSTSGDEAQPELVVFVDLFSPSELCPFLSLPYCHSYNG